MMKLVLNRIAPVVVLSMLIISCRTSENSSEGQKANSAASPAATATTTTTATTPAVTTGSGGSNANANTAASRGGSGEVSPEVKFELSTATRELLGLRLRGESRSVANLLADDYKDTKPGGAVEDKAQYLANLKPFEGYGGFIYDEFKVNSLQGDTATVSGLVQVMPEDKSKKSLYSRFTWTFVRRGGKWLLQSSKDTEMKDSY